MYLVGAEISKSSTLTEWNGRTGRFVRTFGINTKRNKNLWRVSWESIKKYVGTAIGFPGIEYEKCTFEDGCDLDHVEADSFSEVIEKQKPFHRTKIIDYVINEIEESVDFIHEVYDDAFWERLNQDDSDVQYVSPMIWPYTEGFEVVDYDVFGNPIIDAWAWKFVHDAFLTQKPAFGENIAKIKSTCEGENCQVTMLAARVMDNKEKIMCGNCKFFVENNTCQLVKGEIGYEDICDLHESGETNPKDTPVNPRYEKDTVHYKYNKTLKADTATTTSTANSNNLSHLQEIPLLYRHKNNLHYIAASDKVQQIIKKKKDAGIKIDDQALAIAYSEAGESNKAKSSFKTCTCVSNQNKMPTEEEYKNLQSKLKAAEDDKKDLEGKLKANNDYKDKEAKYGKAKARFVALFKGNTNDERKNLISKMKGTEDEEHMKAMEEVHKDMKAKEDGDGNDTTITKLKASIEKLQKQNLPTYIDGLISLKASSGVDQKTLREYHTALLAKSFDDVETLYTNDEIIIKGLSAKNVPVEHFDFTDETPNSLKGKSSDEIIMEARG